MTNFVAISYEECERLTKTALGHICAADRELGEKLQAEKERIMSTKRHFFGMLKWSERKFQNELSWSNSSVREYTRLLDDKREVWHDARNIEGISELLTGKHLVSSMFYITSYIMAILIKYQTKQVF